YLNAYLIHHLFLDFLRAKHEILTEEETLRTYQIAALWSSQNGFKVDALSYYEKIGDYKSIVSIFFDFPLQVPSDIAIFAEQLFDRAPPDIYVSVRSFAAIHTRVVISLGKWQKALKLLAYYEEKLLQLPEDASLNYTLAGLYYAWGMVRQMVSTMDDCYDFHLYYAKMDEYMAKTNVEPNKLTSHSIIPWISLVGSARGGAPQEYIDALSRAEEYASRCYNGRMAGSYDLARGELKFYQGDVRAAESLIVKGLEKARAYGQFTQVHRALFYMLRIAVAQGNFAKAESALKDTEALLNVTAYTPSFLAYDITLGAYYNFALQPQRVPGWLRGEFSPYGHPVFKENSANQIKLHYCYITDNFAYLLTYIEEEKRRESILYGRVELQAMEACIRFKTKDKGGAFAALREAYETALPNALLMPFICLGKDMQTLATEALHEYDCAIPKPWLETVIRKSTSYARRHKKFISDYRKAKGFDDEIVLSSSESEILRAVYNGLSHKEIAANLNLSANTVKIFINSIYEKLNARNIADVMRIAVERKLV
ncbi:MAG: LuxR C-terminal-related transcriptional regulator, partial [Synergistaceae bacterium]|nr:LuxR C-terminal-related transcriptional regulator [Synergistaceae bacterium]